MRTETFSICLLSAAYLIVACCSCTSLQPYAGDVVDTPNEIVGIITDSSGYPVDRVRVSLLPEGYDPLKDMAGSVSPADTTDESGNYSLTAPTTGRYTIEAVHIDNRSRALITGVVVGTADTTRILSARVRKPGAIKVAVPGNRNATNGYFYIPGTRVFSWQGTDNDYAVLDSVPADVPLPVYYAVRGSPVHPHMVVDSLAVAPGVMATIYYSQTRFSKRLQLNTASTGANIAGDVFNFPVLVRLTNSNFNFAQAAGKGEDLCFTKSNGSFLAYEIEDWDSAGQTAAVWVKLDTIYGNSDQQFITLCWGADSLAGSSVTGVSNGAAVFDTAAGFQGVWHLAEAGTDTVHDATGNRYSGVLHNPSASVVPGMIGTAVEFNGVSDFITIANTAGSKLNFPERGTYSISAWVYSHVTDSNFHVVVSKGDFDYTLQQYYSNDWEITEFLNNTGWDARRAPVVKNTWTLLQAVRTGTAEYLYVNGDLADSSALINGSASPRNTSFDVMIGRIPDHPDSIGRFFDGIIDEVRISSIACLPDWIKLCYLNQKPDGRLVEFK
jgi:hypothetical protein